MPETRVMPNCYLGPPGPELHQKCGRAKITPPFSLRPSPIWNARSQTVAGSSEAISSASGQTSIGGPSQPPRANQPEIVLRGGSGRADLIDQGSVRFIVGEPARTVEDRKPAVRVCVNAHGRLDEVAAGALL